ncbi:helix-turn-helix domain-containing protein [Micropruina sp.]|uniref:helix-turn-helix domain-containing protein n=1 Tax=Micropruina sp. TaxID=2737536 RepID=UPI0039E29FB9
MTMQVSTPSQLGAAVRRLRRDRGLTQRQLAASAGISTRWLVMFENGQNVGAEVSKIFDVLWALGMTVEVVPSPEPSPEEAELLALLGDG